MKMNWKWMVPGWLAAATSGLAQTEADAAAARAVLAP